MKKSIFILLAGLVSFAAMSQEGDKKIAKNDPKIVSWASGVEVNRDADVTYGRPFYAVGVADTGNLVCVSLGNGGNALVTFDRPIINGPGADFAVFENAFAETFMELAFVEVSSDGVHFFRFPAVSTATEDSKQPSDYYNLAGNTDYHYGTGFDLDDLEDNADLDKNNIRLVRIVDVVSGQDKDSKGNVIYDPVTPGYSAGFDLSGVCVINAGKPYLIADMENLLSQENAYELPSAENFDEVAADNSKHKNYVSNGLLFPGVVEPTYSMAIGWGLSNITNPATASATSVSGTGWDNNYYAAADTCGVDGSGKVYLQGYYSSYNSEEHMVVEKADGKEFTPEGVYVAQSMSSFIYESEQEDLWFKVVAEGLDNTGAAVKTAELYLRDARQGGVGNRSDWRWLDLSSFGTVSKIKFSLQTNDAAYYIPMYLCLDNFVYQNDATQSALTVNNAAEGITVYPVPAKDYVTVGFDFDRADVYLTDVYGRTINSVNGAVNNVRFDNLSAGVYFVKVVSANKTVTKKIIVR
ncbi:MAG: DUF4465 domain-containing protein [Bacteroidales bacterium]|nr:DUF4465 domain-containing protein [Bacteroidales bacterium]